MRVDADIVLQRSSLNPRLDPFEWSFTFDATAKIYAMTLRDTLLTPVPPLSDEETGDKKDEGGKDKAAGAGKDAKGGKEETAAGGKKAAEPEPMKVELDGIQSRVAALPIPAGTYGRLGVFKGKLLFAAFAPFSGDDGGAGRITVKVFDFDKREVKTVISGLSGGVYSKDGSKILYHAKDDFGIVDAAEGKKVGDGKLATDQLQTLVDPRQEWLQIFNEGWRLERDFYYDPNMGGLDWKAVGDHYRQLLPYVAHRADLDYVMGEMQGELSTSHTYIIPNGDLPQVPRVDIGLLGADYDLDAKSGRYRFQTIYRARDWNSSVEAPLGMPGIGVKEGDYLLSVNGRPVTSPANLYAAFEGTTGKQTQITVGRTPDDPKPRTYTVKPIANDASLRYTAWVTTNRTKVAQATGGRVAYIHVPDTSFPGIEEFTKQYYPQVDKQALIVDGRFNAGGFDPYFYVSRLSQRTWNYVSQRDGKDQRLGSVAIDGPKCFLINQFAGSGGDAFPYYFRQMGIGPLIGERTWGGLVGYGHAQALMDGTGIQITMPDAGWWDPSKHAWMAEQHGVDPDIEVENTPSEVVAGHDPQLERAIQWTLDQLQKSPPQEPQRPPYPVQAGLH